MIGHSVSTNGQVRTRFGLIEIATRGAGATALRRDGAIHRTKTFLLITVEIVRARVARLHARFNHRFKQRIDAGFGGGDAHRAIATVVVVLAHIASLGLAVVGQAVEITPVLQTGFLRPVIEIQRIATDVAHAVDQRRSTQTFTASALHAAVIHKRFRFRFIGPVVAFTL